jgi:peptidoglycan/LPS O-acetylase OafA/YrhL
VSSARDQVAAPHQLSDRSAPRPASPRDRYFDLLRAMALVRIIAYHSLGLAWLTVVFPAVGLMFALGGSLMAASIDRSGLSAVGRRLRRLLPPLWMIAVVSVPVMLLSGLHVNWSLLLWLLPLRSPPVNGWGTETLGIVWYLREYLWFVLVSPLALAAFRRFPVPVVLSTLALLVTLMITGWIVPTEIADFAVYGGCWLLGFAQHDGLLRRMGRPALLGVAGTLTVVGMGWLLTHPGPRGYDLNDNALSNAVWSMAFVLVLLGMAPSRAPRDRPRLARALKAVNSRAMTLYLWHSTAIGVTYLLARHWSVSLGGHLGHAVLIGSVLTLLAAAVLAFGWVEDLAARRRPALLPG